MCARKGLHVDFLGEICFGREICCPACGVGAGFHPCTKLAQLRSHEDRRWLFEEATQSRISPGILQYTKRNRCVCSAQTATDKSAFESGPLRAVHLSRDQWPGRLVNWDFCPGNTPLVSNVVTFLPGYPVMDVPRAGVPRS